MARSNATNTRVRRQKGRGDETTEKTILADPDLEICWRSIDALKPYAGNARAHTDKQIAQIAASIGEFGFTNPVLVDAEGGIIAGHGRVEAARRLGSERIPTIRLDHLSEAQKRAYLIADNRLAELAGWDPEILAIEFGELGKLELDYDLEITGFETAEIDLIIERAKEPGPDKADETPEPDDTTPPVSREGDLWRLGKHRLLCANSLESASYSRLLEGQQARMVFTDPPYNVRIQGHVCGSGRIRHGEFVMASGEMSDSEFQAFLAKVMGNLAAHTTDGGLIYACMDWRHLFDLQLAARNKKLNLVNLCVWNKNNGGLGSFYRSKHELIPVFRNGDTPHTNNIELGKYGRYRTNVWDYEGVNTMRKGRMEDLAMHPTVKPVALIADAIRDCTRRAEIVLDAFAGSGSTIIAAEKTGRICHAIELDSRYVDVAVRRWQKFTGEQAIHADTGHSFDQTSAGRASDVDRLPPIRERRRSDLTRATAGKE